MDKKYKIRYLPLFYNDLEKIIDYIANELDNNIAANNLLTEIETAIERRSYNPSNYEKFFSIKERNDTYYRIYIKNYIIFYIVKDDIMEIRRIIYNKRNLKELI